MAQAAGSLLVQHAAETAEVHGPLQSDPGRPHNGPCHGPWSSFRLSVSSYLPPFACSYSNVSFLSSIATSWVAVKMPFDNSYDDLECEGCYRTFNTYRGRFDHMKALDHFQTYCVDCDRNFMNGNNLDQVRVCSNGRTPELMISSISSLASTAAPTSAVHFASAASRQPVVSPTISKQARAHALPTSIARRSTR